MKKIKSAKRTVPSKILVFLLTLSLISAPFSLYAVEISETKDETPLTIEAESDVFILAEEQSQRGEFEKHFLMSDGTVLAASYPEAVHYKEGKEWTEIDNSLSFEKGFYHNSNKKFSVRFAHNAKSNDVISIDYENYSLSWSLKINSATKGTGLTMSEDAVVVIDNSSDAKDADESTAMLYANKAQSKIYYYDAFGKDSAIDVSYGVTHNKVKEDVIINRLSDFSSLTVLVNSGVLLPKLSKDNSIEFVNSTGDVIFTLCKPYMYDSAGEVLYDIAVNVSSVKNGCSITYTPNYKWMSDPERVYPIVLDPTVVSSAYQANYVDTYVHVGDSAGDHTTEAKLYFGLRNSQLHRSYLKILQLPSVPTNSSICEAKLWGKITAGTDTSAPLSIYKVTTPWDVNTISFDNQPSSTLLEDNVPCDLNKLEVNFNVINSIALINSLTFVNHGFMIQYTDENYNDYNCIYSSDCGNNARLPLLTIKYYPKREEESNNNFDSATVIDISVDTGRTSNVRGSLSSATDIDYYMIQPPRHGRVQVMVTFPSGYIYSVSVYNKDHTLIETDEDRLHNYNYFCNFKVTRGNADGDYIDTHYIEISSNGTVSSSDYYLSVFYSSAYYDLDWQYPVNGRYRISSPVGHRTLSGSPQYHKGIDIPGSTSDTIYSVCDGTVIGNGYDNNPNTGMGNYLIIKADDIDPDTGKHYVIRYMHLSEKSDDITNRVRKGQELGKMGTTGASTGVHLHIDINDEGKSGSLGIYDLVNPIDFFNDDIHFYGKVFTRD